MDSSRASTLELLGGLSRCWEVLRPLEPHLSLYSTKNELGSTIGSYTSLFDVYLAEGGMVVYTGGVSELHH
jgi:hypothetical protein